jgi:hypothetical protein
MSKVILNWELMVDPTILHHVVELFPDVKHGKSMHSSMRIFQLPKEDIEAVTSLLAGMNERAYIKRVTAFDADGVQVDQTFW